ncbi:MAG: dTDP-4-dehydrorhamnose 3,5-epimerase [Proteobacteria bacterium]|nr:dTDP-4-dehydrorhamnose 3,5-epimerase [Pseudomonadota bacterium]
MKFHPTPITDLFVAESSVIADERGSFMRLYCAPSQQQSLGFKKQIVQINRSITNKKGSLRGLHYQKFPALEAKMVRCTRGMVYDVAVDLRNGSKTFLKHFSIELDGQKGQALVIPEGFAHGFQTLEDDCEMLYLHSAAYAKEHEGGLRYDDPALGIHWPLPAGTLSPRDLSFALIDNNFKGITHAV